MRRRSYGIEGRVFISKSSGRLHPEPLDRAHAGYDLVIGVGFLMGDQLAAVAKRFPDTKFAIVDYPAAALKGKPKNVARHRLRGAGGRVPRRRRGGDACRSRA